MLIRLFVHWILLYRLICISNAVFWADFLIFFVFWLGFQLFLDSFADLQLFFEFLADFQLFFEFVGDFQLFFDFLAVIFAVAAVVCRAVNSFAAYFFCLEMIYK